MLSGSSTSETHRGHREPCETFRRLRAEWGDRLTRCQDEVSEHWHGTGGVRKCATCLGVAREQAKLRRTTERKAKMAARKQELENRRVCRKYRNIAPAVSIEAVETVDNVNPLPPTQAQEPMIDQDTVVKSEPSTPRYGERRSDEDVAGNSIADTTAWEASQREAAQAQPVKEEEKDDEERQGKDSVATLPGFEIEHQYSPSPPHNQHCSCGAQGHKIDTLHEASRRSNTLYDALFFDQFTTKAFEYDPTWKAECGAVMSVEEQGDVLRLFSDAVDNGFGEMGGKDGGSGGEARGMFGEVEGDS